MAKKMMGSGMVCRCGPSNFIWMIIASIVMAIGAYVFVLALQTQWSGAATFVNVALWYTLAFIILGFAKLAKMKSMDGCDMHAKMM